MIGVVGDAKYDDLRSPAPPTSYLPISQGAEAEREAVVHGDGAGGWAGGAAAGSGAIDRWHGWRRIFLLR